MITSYPLRLTNTLLLANSIAYEKLQAQNEDNTVLYRAIGDCYTRMEARQTELNVAERIVAGDITELSISGRRVFECPLIVVFRIHDVFVLLGVALTTGGVFKMRGRTVVAARSLDVVRTDVMACHAIHILMSTAC